MQSQSRKNRFHLFGCWLLNCVKRVCRVNRFATRVKRLNYTRLINDKGRALRKSQHRGLDAKSFDKFAFWIRNKIEVRSIFLAKLF